MNEQENVDALLLEVEAAMTRAGLSAELIVVDDGSSDETLARLNEHLIHRPWLRVLHWATPRGQSAALGAGIEAARAPFIATLDADLQNDPADMSELLQRVRRGEADMAQGVRRNRNDNLLRRLSSRIGRAARLLILGDTITDTGCSTRVVRAELARRLPLQFAGMHRFLPAYARMLGATVVEVDVRHHIRRAGATKYSVRNRAITGLVDCFILRWMRHRIRSLDFETSTDNADRPAATRGTHEGVPTELPQRKVTQGGARS